MSINDPAPTESSPRFLPFVILLFIGSGCAALIYEVVWFQMLQLVIGSSAISLGALLATFMGGMCAGSLLWPRVVRQDRHPLRVYAFLEICIGLCGLLVLWLMPVAGSLYASIAGQGYTGVTLRAVLAAILLLPPTFMMGATLPVIARWIEATPRGVSWLGFFYGGNTAGAVVGCLLGGFYLLRVHNMAFATYAAFAINATVAIVAFSLAGESPHRPPAADSPPDPRSAPESGAVFTSIAISGFCALAAEVVWTRMLSLLLGGTVYTFSIILAVFLAGIGIGSAAGSVLARESRNPRVFLGLCQLLQAGAIVWATIMLGSVLPYWPVDTTITVSPVVNLQMDLARCASALLPPALLWGASFPLALAGVAVPGHDNGRIVGKAYAANTVGAILGSIGTALVLVPRLGTHDTQQFLIGLTVVSALVAFLPAWKQATTTFGKGLGFALVIAAPFTVGWLMKQVPALPWPLVAYGRQMPITSTSGTEALYVGEGLNSTVGVTEMGGGVRSFHVAGKTEASTLAKDMRLQRMLGDIPALIHGEPKSVLIVGCGAGVTAGSFIPYPSIKRIVICEIEPLIPQKIAPYFRSQNYDVVDDPRVEIVYDDARHYILTTKEKFDIITSDPIHPWVKGAATLYTAEYFEMVKARLNPGGLVTQWVPFYESSANVVKSEMATFFSVFPDGTVWGNDENGYGYDVVMLGRNGTLKVDIDSVEDRIRNQSYWRVLESLQQVNLSMVSELFGTYAGRHSELIGWLGNAAINRDRDLRLQYLAGLQLNSNEGRSIYVPMLSFRRFPSDILVGREDSISALAASMGLAQ